MPQFDRLSSLINRFALNVTPTSADNANLIILENLDNRQPSRILLAPLGLVDYQPSAHETPLFCAHTEWGGKDNPLFATLPSQIEIEIGTADDMSMLVRLLKAEGEAQRCGVNGALNRLGEVLMIRILRHQIERGSTSTGLLGGLADARLSKAIVSIHEAPGKPWKNDDLAAIAGLSLSRFAELFQQRVGESPHAYLRRWRMTLARQDIRRGDRIQSVAARYGYRSSEALSRAFRRQFGSSPISERHRD